GNIFIWPHCGFGEVPCPPSGKITSACCKFFMCVSSLMESGKVHHRRPDQWMPEGESAHPTVNGDELRMLCGTQVGPSRSIGARRAENMQVTGTVECSKQKQMTSSDRQAGY